MSRKFRNLVGILLTSGLLLLGAVQVFAAPAAPAAPGSGPDSALAPSKGWTSIGVGQRVWYTFKYAGDNSQVNVEMSVSPSNSVAFAVWTPQNVADWASKGEHPIGRGSSNPRVNGGDLLWSGNFYTPGSYYVVVDGMGPGVGNYLLTVNGSGVTVAEPAPAAAPAATAKAPAKAPVTSAVTTTVKATVPVTPTVAPKATTAVTATVKAAVPVTTTTTAKPAAPAAAATPTGMGPETAKTANGEWAPIAVGQRVWYAFKYLGDNSQITIKMQASPSGAATFAVWTPGNLLDWQSGNGENPVGRGGSESIKFNISTTQWSGNTDKAGTYYVVVDQTGSAAGGYQLSIEGTGVSATR